MSLNFFLELSWEPCIQLWKNVQDILKIYWNWCKTQHFHQIWCTALAGLLFSLLNGHFAVDNTDSVLLLLLSAIWVSLQQYVQCLLSVFCNIGMGWIHLSFKFGALVIPSSCSRSIIYKLTFKFPTDEYLKRLYIDLVS